MEDNKIFFRKQGIRTRIIVNKMLVLIKMISLFIVFSSFVALIDLSLLLMCPPLVTPGWLALVNTRLVNTKTCFQWNLKIHAHVFPLLLEENVI